MVLKHWNKGLQSKLTNCSTQTQTESIFHISLQQNLKIDWTLHLLIILSLVKYKYYRRIMISRNKMRKQFYNW